MVDIQTVSIAVASASVVALISIFQTQRCSNWCLLPVVFIDVCICGHTLFQAHVLSCEAVLGV